MPAPREGDVLIGKYRVERVLGEGGMGIVVAATHLQLREKVALKFLLLEVSEGSEEAARFLREAQAAVKIKSEHVARVIDVGTMDTGAPYMVMEYLEGEDLGAKLAREKTLPVADAVDYVLQACEAIAAAHANGIVHRDLKPGNLFLTRRTNGTPCVKVLDFGISKVDGQGGVEPRLTKTNGVLGTPAYMSPEQLRSSRDVDARSDIWSLGSILYELLAGDIPFEANSMPELFSAVLNDPPKDLRAQRPDVPPRLAEVVTKCLQKDRTLRYASIEELAAELVPFSSQRVALLAHEPRPSKTSTEPAGPAGASEEPSEPAAGEGAPATGSKSLVLGVGVGVVVAGLLAWMVLRAPSERAGAARPAPSQTAATSSTASPGFAPGGAPPSLPTGPAATSAATVVIEPAPLASSPVSAAAPSATPAPQRPTKPAAVPAPNVIDFGGRK